MFVESGIRNIHMLLCICHNVFEISPCTLRYILLLLFIIYHIFSYMGIRSNVLYKF